jgi:1,4-dihydroxy-2-naphthoyl-CoA hydrolase
MWFSEFTPEALNDRPNNHIGALLDIKFTEVGSNFIKATMPVDERTHQPAGILHGGASVVLAETLGSIASYMCIDPQKYIAVGLEVNANHLRPVKNGLVTGICTPLHIGAKTHVWEIKIYTDKDKMSCVSRLTVAILPKPL